MVGRGIIAAAFLLWAGVLGTVLWTGAPTPLGAGTPLSAAGGLAAGNAAAPNEPRVVLTGLPFRSVTMQLQRPDWIDKYERSVDEIAALGADTVMFVVDPRMEHGESNRIYLDLRMVPSAENLTRLIKYAKAKGLRVILMPIVLLDAPRKSTEWRGTIKPENWNDWWESYGGVMNHFAWIAQGSGVDLLVVGSELVSTEKRVEDWRKLIRDVRAVFKGKLTYSSNWDHYTAVTFWDDLDLIGMNSYWSLDQGKESKAQVEDIKAAWRDIQGDVLAFAAKQGKPVMFLEAGWCSIANAAHEPWDYTQSSEPLDLDLQRRLFQGFFESWYGNTQLGGFSVWEWPPEAGGPKDRGYTPRGKPAEKIIRDYFALPPWTVTVPDTRRAPRPRNGKGHDINNR